MIYPKPYSIYLRGTMGLRGLGLQPLEVQCNHRSLQELSPPQNLPQLWQELLEARLKVVQALGFVKKEVQTEYYEVYVGRGEEKMETPI